MAHIGINLIEQHWSPTLSSLIPSTGVALWAFGCPVSFSSAPITSALEWLGLQYINFHGHWTLAPLILGLLHYPIFRKLSRASWVYGLEGLGKQVARLFFGIFVQPCGYSHCIRKSSIHALHQLRFNQRAKLRFQPVHKTMDDISHVTIRQGHDHIVKLSTILCDTTFLADSTLLVPCNICIIQREILIEEC